MARHAPSALGAALLHAATAAARQAAAPAAPPRVLAGQLAVRLPRVLRAAAQDARSLRRRRGVPQGDGHDDRPTSRRASGARSSGRHPSRLAPQHVPGELLRQPARRREVGRRRARGRAPRLRARAGRVDLDRRARALPVRRARPRPRRAAASGAHAVARRRLAAGVRRPRWKDDLLHRVQRVDDRTRVELPPAIDGSARAV